MKNTDPDIAVLVDGFKLSCLAEGKSPKTIEWYTAFLGRFRRFLVRCAMPTTAGHIDRNHVRAFIRYLQTEARVPRKNVPPSPSTVQGYVRTLNAFFSWLAREEYIEDNPMTRVPVPKAPLKVIDTFTAAQIRSLLDTGHPSSQSGCRDLSILLPLLDSGIRVSELANIDLDDVDLASTAFFRVTSAPAEIAPSRIAFAIASVFPVWE
ncbi:MAG: phage integrase N-terminal SAM-like domain-containing protein [Chloroflexi bacterium]|nr:phage integrase N-terminal SAM-like domain-containing protein [Chloroflexota bacterium]